MQFHFDQSVGRRRRGIFNLDRRPWWIRCRSHLGHRGDSTQSRRGRPRCRRSLDQSRRLRRRRAGFRWRRLRRRAFVFVQRGRQLGRTRFWVGSELGFTHRILEVQWNGLANDRKLSVCDGRNGSHGRQREWIWTRVHELRSAGPSDHVRRSRRQRGLGPRGRARKRVGVYDQHVALPNGTEPMANRLFEIRQFEPHHKNRDRGLRRRRSWQPLRAFLSRQERIGCLRFHVGDSSTEHLASRRRRLQRSGRSQRRSCQDLSAIWGAGFASGATVTIGGNACTSVVVASPFRITCTTPAGTAGPRNVVVTTGGRTATLANGFTY